MASTYSNLRLDLQGTGDNSGTWGTVANGVFSQLDEAIAGIATVDFATDANKTITASDGVSSDARHMVLLLTSTGALTDTRDLTIAPNTMEKVFIIHNGTTGGEAIRITQGSGAKVTIKNGHRGVVYCDGGGAGAIVTSVMSGIEMDRPLFNSYTEQHIDLGAVTTANCDLSLYSVFEIIAGATLIVNFQNAPVSGQTASATLIITNNATPVSSYTWKYGGSAIGTLKSPGGTDPAPTNSANAEDVFTAFTFDAGSTFYISEGMLDVS